MASLAKRWLLGTHQSSVEEVRQGSYLNVFVFRFNRRREASERLAYYRVLELAVGRDPVRYRKLVANPGPKKIPPSPPDAQGHPPSLDRPARSSHGQRVDLHWSAQVDTPETPNSPVTRSRLSLACLGCDHRECDQCGHLGS